MTEPRRPNPNTPEPRAPLIIPKGIHVLAVSILLLAVFLMAANEGLDAAAVFAVGVLLALMLGLNLRLSRGGALSADRTPIRPPVPPRLVPIGGQVTMTVVRIEPPTHTVLELRSVPGLARIELHPPAAGPEVELVFAGVPEDESEEAFRERVELATGCRILALAIRKVG